MRLSSLIGVCECEFVPVYCIHIQFKDLSIAADTHIAEYSDAENRSLFGVEKKLISAICGRVKSKGGW
jgi:hypothetical protein